jgi:rubrerythrin
MSEDRKASLFFLSIERKDEENTDDWFQNVFSHLQTLFKYPNACTLDSQKEIHIAIFSSIAIDERMLKLLINNSLIKADFDTEKLDIVLVSAGVSQCEKDIEEFLLND